MISPVDQGRALNEVAQNLQLSWIRTLVDAAHQAMRSMEQTSTGNLREVLKKGQKAMADQSLIIGNQLDGDAPPKAVEVTERVDEGLVARLAVVEAGAE